VWSFEFCQSLTEEHLWLINCLLLALLELLFCREDFALEYAGLTCGLLLGIIIHIFAFLNDLVHNELLLIDIILHVFHFGFKVLLLGFQDFQVVLMIFFEHFMSKHLLLEGALNLSQLCRCLL